jgi:hypothetical protein
MLKSRVHKYGQEIKRGEVPLENIFPLPLSKGRGTKGEG